MSHNQSELALWPVPADLKCTDLSPSVTMPASNRKEKLKSITSAWNQTQNLWNPNRPEAIAATETIVLLRRVL